MIAGPSTTLHVFPSPYLPREPRASTSQAQHSTALHLPVITPRAAAAEPNEVVVDLSTLVTIPDFTKYYHDTPVQSFVPVYYALSDGSLVAPPLIHDLELSYSGLIVGGAIFVIFLRNIIVSAGYIWSGKVKKKGLLYTLFCSQLLGPPALISMMAVHFRRSIQCSVVLRLSDLSAGFSLSLLITGIFGVKAYRCLDNARLVLFPLVGLRTAGVILLVVDTVLLETERSLSGRCCRISGGLQPAFVILMFVESLFICFCFLYAVWKSHGSAAVRGRISLTLSLEDVAVREENEVKESVDSNHRPRGWWDYVPNRESTAHLSTRSRQRIESVVSQERSIISVVRDRTRTLVNSDLEPDPEAPPPPQSSANGEFGRPRRPRTSTVRMSETIDGPSFARREAVLPHLPYRPASPALSSMSRITRYIPRMALFREVMRDELCYTTFITCFTVVSVVLVLVGVNSETYINTSAWIGLDWAVMSCLAMHSFGRVIRRHENEALLQHPNAWCHSIYTDRSTAELLRDRRSRLPRSSGGMSSRLRTRRVVPASRHDDLSDSINDSSLRHLCPNQGTWSSGETRSFTASTNGTSSMFSPIHTVESFPRIHEHSVPPTPSGRDSPMSHECDLGASSQNVSTTADLPEDRYSSTTVPARPDPPDAESSFHSLSHEP
ncbi:hypothetical protein BV22DRAFT_999103 [Leucogyrophana mollusca]|uniref:Uncharacterized protein n=1 Tax=Leucogyrophana mollusca TaxID=85980 RepID=A0ACB8C0V5_9AGAM|nr:hypothetical protein BV22DRAFT_999103 [Leucogyrophana mollusca]